MFIKNEYPVSTYTPIGRFDSTGLAQGHVENNLGEIGELRIRVIAHSGENWVIFSEVSC